MQWLVGPNGAVTTFTYGTTSPYWTLATTGTRWTKTTMDGFGRPIKVEAERDPASGEGWIEISIRPFAGLTGWAVWRLAEATRQHRLADDLLLQQTKGAELAATLASVERADVRHRGHRREGGQRGEGAARARATEEGHRHTVPGTGSTRTVR